MVPLAELMLVPPFLADLGPGVPPFARDSGVSGGVTTADIFGNGSESARKSSRDACVKGVGTWYRGAVWLVVLACCVDGTE